MKKRLCSSVVSAMTTCLVVLGFTSQSHAQLWEVTNPAANTTFTQTSRVSGTGKALTNNTPAVFSFSYFNDAGVETIQNSTTVTSYEMGVTRLPLCRGD